jgi:hypothetical protein
MHDRTPQYLPLHLPQHLPHQYHNQGEGYQEKEYQDKLYQENAYQENAYQENAYQEKAYQEKLYQEKSGGNIQPEDQLRRSRSKTKCYDSRRDHDRGRGTSLKGRTTSQDGLTGPSRTRDSSNPRGYPLRHSSNPGPTTTNFQKKKFGRNNSSELLQTAINQNHQFRSTLTKSFSAQNLATTNEKSKNIPMAPEQKNSRPTLKRWNSFNMVYKNEEANHENNVTTHDNNVTLMETIHSTKDSISPLTVLKDQYNIKRPLSLQTNPNTNSKEDTISNPNTISNPDNSFSNLLDTKFSDLTPTTSTGGSSKTNKFYNKMSQIVNLAHDSMHSLVPMFNKDFITNENTDPTNTSSIVSGNISNFQSEDDESEDDADDRKTQDNNELDTQYRLELWKSPTVLTNPEAPENVGDFQSIVNEINQFQSTFVDKFTNSPSESTFRTNRTQQKILDYKELYSIESPSSLSILASQPSTLAPPISSILNSYNVKIQCETITSQYTAIRLRFASRIPSDLDKSNKNMKPHTGVLGFLNRLELLNETRPTNEWLSKCTSDYYSEDKNISFENRDHVLKSIWETQLNSKFNSNGIEVAQDPVDDETIRTSNESDESIGTSNEMDESIGTSNEMDESFRTSNETDESIKVDFSQMARNVKFN